MRNETRRIWFFAFAALLLFISGCVSTSSGSQSIQQKFEIWWGAWMLPLYAAFGIGIGICALSWFYASFVQDDKLKVWVKSEVVQLGYSAVIVMGVMLVIGSVTFICAELPKLGGMGGGEMGVAWGDYVWARCEVLNVEPSRPCHIRMAEDYLEILAKSSQAQATSILRYISFLYPLNTIGIGFKGIPAPGGALSVAPFGGLTPVIDTMDFAFDMLMKNLLTIRAQQYAVDFMHVAFFPYMIAAGIFFRTLYFTRKLGGLLIALGFGFYIVLPLMYVFWASILFSFTGPWVSTVDQSAISDPGIIGTNMLVNRYSFGTVNTGPVMPVAAAKSYYDAVNSADYPQYSYRGQACADGIIQPWEDCGEENTAIDATTGKEYDVNAKGPFVCPSGQMCDTNACKCTEEFYSGGTGNFREDYVIGSGPNGEILLGDNARIIAEMCFEAPADEDETTALVKRANKAWYERLLEGLGGGFARAMPSDYLLGANGTIDNMAKLLVFSLVAPFISLMVALGTVKVLSPTFGGDVEIAGLSRLL